MQSIRWRHPAAAIHIWQCAKPRAGLFPHTAGRAARQGGRDPLASYVANMSSHKYGRLLPLEHTNFINFNHHHVHVHSQETGIENRQGPRAYGACYVSFLASLSPTYKIMFSGRKEGP